MLNVARLTVGLYEENAYLGHFDGRAEAFLVDPGDKPGALISEIERRGLRLTHIFITHGHFDHILAVPELVRETGAKVWVHERDEEMLFDPHPLKLPSSVKARWTPLKLTAEQKVLGSEMRFPYEAKSFAVPRGGTSPDGAIPSDGVPPAAAASRPTSVILSAAKDLPRVSGRACGCGASPHGGEVLRLRPQDDTVGADGAVATAGTVGADGTAEADGIVATDGTAEANGVVGADGTIGEHGTATPDASRETAGEGALIRMIETPGHTPGGVCFYFPEQRLMFTGDTLFRDGFGRTDFASSRAQDLRKSLQALLQMDEDIRIYPGHGDSDTIGAVKRRFGL